MRSVAPKLILADRAAGAKRRHRLVKTTVAALARRRSCRRPYVQALVALVCAGVIPSKADAVISSDRAAAIVNFPYVTLDSSRGIDTTIRLSNAADDDPVDVACFLENATSRCESDPAQTCFTAADCPASGVCSRLSFGVQAFSFRLTHSQPISWLLSSGLAELPLPMNSGAIPAAPDDPFIGTLRCVAVDASGVPAARDVLQGDATLERYQSAANLLDAATYNGIGLAAGSAAAVDDGQLLLGGSQAEYQGCPSTIFLNHFFDHAVDPVTRVGETITTLALMPCGADLSRATRTVQQVGSALVQYTVYNEFEQHLSTSSVVRIQAVTPLSSIDSAIPTRSLFSAGISGTPTGQTVIRGFGAGIMGVAVEAHSGPAGSLAPHTAAINLHSEGERPEADVIALRLSCPEQPTGDCRSARSSRLRLSERARDRGDRVRWEWRQGDATSEADFGDPEHTTTFKLCVYGGGSGRSVATIPPSADGWNASAHGFAYSDRSGAADGVVKVKLQASTRNRARAAVRARGANVPALGLEAPLSTPVLVQLINDTTGVCLQSVFDADDVRRNEPDTFETQTNP